MTADSTATTQADPSAARPSSDGSAGGKARLNLRAKRVLVLVGVLAVWQIAGMLSQPLLLPTPWAVLTALYDITFHGDLIPALASSMKLLAIGFGIAIVLGCSLGIALGRYRLFDVTFGPYLNALYATPEIALVPLILVWFGFGLGGRVVVVVIASFFPIFINTYAGVRDAPGNLVEVARSFGVRTERGLLRRVVVPAALPFILAGLRLSIGRGVVGMAVAEVYLRLGGIGSLIVQYGAAFKTNYVLAAILPLPVLSILLTKILAMIERRLDGWRTK
jgi:ABC-type nitrate/sulfonate/bicarbonate transport system permease component